MGRTGRRRGTGGCGWDILFERIVNKKKNLKKKLNLGKNVKKGFII